MKNKNLSNYLLCFDLNRLALCNEALSVEYRDLFVLIVLSLETDITVLFALIADDNELVFVKRENLWISNSLLFFDLGGLKLSGLLATGS